MHLTSYPITFLFVAALFWSGWIFIRRITTENRIQVLVPSGMVLGINCYIFLINLIAHIIKGPVNFYISLIILIVVTFFVKKTTKATPVYFSEKKNIAFWISTLIWFIFLLSVTASGPAISADSFTHYALGSVFARGDYPIHLPWQPDYFANYHIGFAELLGATKTITHAPYEFLFALFEFIELFCLSLILTWFVRVKKVPLLMYFIPAAFGLISVGSIWFAWPTSFAFSHFDGQILEWFKKFPTLYHAFVTYGTQNSLESFMAYPHRILALSSFLTILVVIFSPKKQLFLLVILAILLASIGLTDESTFVVTIPAILLVIFFTIFRKSLLKFLIYVSLLVLLIVFQGGILSNIVLNPNHTSSDILIFPPDEYGPSAKNYRNDRLAQQRGKLISNQEYYPLIFFNLGMPWRVGLLLIFSTFLLWKYNKDNNATRLWIFSLTSLIALLAYHAIVPKGYLHINGNRLLGLSYYLSGLNIIYLIYLFWGRINYLFKIVLLWVLLISIIPALLILYPRQDYNWYTRFTSTDFPVFKWVKDNINLQDRILILVDPFPTASPYGSILKEEGAFTPLWPPNIRVLYGMGISPTYNDIFFTLNPSLLKQLKVKYIIVNDTYIPQLPKQRIPDLSNSSFFKPIYKSTTSNNVIILEILDNYFTYGKDLGGTLAELSQIAPKSGSYYLEGYPAIHDEIYRSTRVALIDRKVYYPGSNGSFYNFQIDVNLTYYGESDDYDYLVLGEKTDPQKICNCKTELMWEGVGNGLKLWRVLEN